MTDERYWRNTGGRHWLNATNLHGLEMGHCNQLRRTQGRMPLRHENLSEADAFTLKDIHRLAELECAGASEGAFAGYGWTDKLCRYAGQARFREKLAELGPLTDVPDPRDPGSVVQCLHDRQAQYQSHYRRRPRSEEVEPGRFTAEAADARRPAREPDDADRLRAEADQRGARLRQMNAEAVAARSPDKGSSEDTSSTSGEERATRRRRSYGPEL